jgi:shikimate kinase
MKYFVIIRGPAGVGKSTISHSLTEKLKADCVSFDKVMSDHGLDNVEGDCIQLYNFVKADDIVIPEVLDKIKTQIVVFDGCFYHLGQIEDLIKRIPGKSYAFNLKASVEECIVRDTKRTGIDGMGDQRVKDVYKLVSKFDYGIDIETGGKMVEEITREILSYLPNES